MSARRPRLGAVAERYALRDAAKVIEQRLGSQGRRLFLRRSLSLGALAMLGGCTIGGEDDVERALTAISRWNDRVQGWLFDPQRLAPTYPASQIVRPFPFNAFYAESRVPQIDADQWRLEVGGRVAGRRRFRLSELAGMTQRSQITRHICVEGWSAIGEWSGVPLREVLARAGADLTARYVAFRCADGYHTSIDMPSALHPQTIVALACNGEPLEPRYGFPVKLRIPTKLGYKNPKHITEIVVTNDPPGGYWEDQGYNWFGGS